MNNLQDTLSKIADSQVRSVTGDEFIEPVSGQLAQIESATQWRDKVVEISAIKQLGQFTRLLDKGNAHETFITIAPYIATIPDSKVKAIVSTTDNKTVRYSTHITRGTAMVWRLTITDFSQLSVSHELLPDMNTIARSKDSVLILMQPNAPSKLIAIDRTQGTFKASDTVLVQTWGSDELVSLANQYQTKFVNTSNNNGSNYKHTSFKAYVTDENSNNVLAQEFFD